MNKCIQIVPVNYRLYKLTHINYQINYQTIKYQIYIHFQIININYQIKIHNYQNKITHTDANYYI